MTLLPALWAAELKVDHVTVAGRDLKAMQAAFEAAGIPTEYGGKHTNGQTEMALASFADGSYLELIAAQSPERGAGKHYWANFIDNNAGPCGWAISVKNIEEEARRFGVPISNGGRLRPDGVELKWMSAAIGPGPQGSFLPFLIQDVTPRELRAFPSGKPTLPSRHGVALVYVGVRNLEEAVARYQQAFGLGEPEREKDPALGATTAHFRGTPVVLAAPDGEWLATRLKQFGEAPCAFVVGRGAGRISWLPIKGMRIGVN